ncbi:MAG: ATP-binding protein [Polyangiales bacterium]
MTQPRWTVVLVGGSPGLAEARKALSESTDPHVRCELAADAAAGLDLCRVTQNVDCVLCDEQLPDMPAGALIAALSGAGGCPQPVVLVLSASGQRAERRVWLDRGAQGCVGASGLSPTGLVDAIEAAIDRGRLARELRATERRLANAQKRAADVGREQEQWLRLALRASGTGVWAWDLETGKLAWTDEAHMLMGSGRFGDITFDEFMVQVHPDDRARVQAAVQASITTGCEYREEFRIIRRDGELRWVIGLGLVERTDSGQPYQMVGTALDVTDRHHAVSLLRERERELRSVADNTPDILARFDRGLRHLFVNAAIERPTGLTPEVFLGKTNRELGMPSALCDDWEGKLQRVFSTGRPLSHEFRFESPTGPMYYSSRLVPERDAAGEVEYVLCVSHDVTELTQAERALRLADTRKDIFLATLAHELRNPLAPIRLGLELLRRPNENDCHAQTIAMIDRQVGQMIRLIDDLTDVSRIASGKVLMRRERVCLQEVLAGAIETSRVALDKAKHELRIAFPREALWVDGDPARLMQVLGNLLNNAVKYTPDGGRIALQLLRDGDHAIVSIEDTGIGIPTSMIEHIFEMFAQAEDSEERAQGGLGIGLALVKQLVELHGGQVEAVSPGIGHGSTFSVRLPLCMTSHARVLMSDDSLAHSAE